MFDNPHKRQFDVSKEQLAHDLTILKMSRSDSASKDPWILYEQYIQELENVKTVIEDKTRYEIEPVSYPEDDE